MGSSDRVAATLGLACGDVTLAPSDPAWAGTFMQLATELRDVLGTAASAVEHIGSSAVPGLVTKPILDIGVLLAPGVEPDDVVAAIESLGYEYRGDAGDGGGLVFVLGPEARRVSHVHVIRDADPQWDRYLIFRDRLRADAALRDAYAVLKTALTERFAHDRAAYTEAKAGFIERVLAGLSRR